MEIDPCKIRPGRMLFAGGTALLGLTILLFSEFLYDAADPARQTHEREGPRGFQERVALTDRRRAQLDEERKGPRILFTSAGLVLAVYGLAMVVRTARGR